MDKLFQDLLLEFAYSDTDEQRKDIERSLWESFGESKAVFVMDMSGFSMLSQRHGVVHYLSMVRRMQLTTEPIIVKHGREVVKFEADNCYASFPDVLPAVEAGVELNATFFRMNELTPDEFDIRVSIGIDYGDILLIGGPDYFGNAVIGASKLGEDTATSGEILTTKRAFERIPAGADITGTHLLLSMSGMDWDTVKIDFPEPTESAVPPGGRDDSGDLDALLTRESS
jgi:class 3 adenylate cyclase